MKVFLRLLSAAMLLVGLLALPSPGLAYDCIENGWQQVPNIISGNQTLSGGDVALNCKTLVSGTLVLQNNAVYDIGDDNQKLVKPGKSLVELLMSAHESLENLELPMRKDTRVRKISI